jgi:hypothetical protein
VDFPVAEVFRHSLDHLLKRLRIRRRICVAKSSKFRPPIYRPESDMRAFIPAALINQEQKSDIVHSTISANAAASLLTPSTVASFFIHHFPTALNSGPISRQETFSDALAAHGYPSSRIPK